MEREIRYEMRGYGDLADPEYNGGYKAGLHKPLEFRSLQEALLFLERWANTIEENKHDYYMVSKLDPEDDKVEIHRVNGAKRKLVWCYYGWHYPDLWNVIEQGKYIGHAKSVYAELMEDC